ILSEEILPGLFIAFRAGGRQAQVIGVQGGQKLTLSFAGRRTRTGVSGNLIDYFAEILFCGSVHSRDHLGIAYRVTPLYSRHELCDVTLEGVLKLVNSHGRPWALSNLDAGSESF